MTILLFRVNDVDIVEILLLALIAALKLGLRSQQKLIPVLLSCVDKKTDNWDAHEEDLQAACELSGGDYLSEQENQISPEKQSG